MKLSTEFYHRMIKIVTIISAPAMVTITPQNNPSALLWKRGFGEPRRGAWEVTQYGGAELIMCCLKSNRARVFHTVPASLTLCLILRAHMLLWSPGQDFMASDCSGLLRGIMSASCRLTTQAVHANPPQLLKLAVSGLRKHPGRAKLTALIRGSQSSEDSRHAGEKNGKPCQEYSTKWNSRSYKVMFVHWRRSF